MQRASHLPGDPYCGQCRMGQTRDSQPFSSKNRRKTEAVPGLQRRAFPQTLRATAF